MRWEVSRCTAAVLSGASFKICSEELVAFFLKIPSRIISMRFVRVHVVHLYGSTVIAASRKKSYFILSVIRFPKIDNPPNVYADIAFIR